MTRAQYIDFIRNSLQMVDQTNKYHREQVAAAINVAVNTVFYEMYEQQPKTFKKSMERYSTIITLTNVVNSGISKSRYNATFTVDIVDLPKKGSGVLEIMKIAAIGAAITTTTTAFVPISTMEGEQFYGSEASLPGNIIGFSFSNGDPTATGTLEFWNMDAATATAGVKARVIKQFRSYSSTDNVLLPYGQDARIIELVRQFLGDIPPKDLVNNNADPQRNG